MANLIQSVLDEFIEEAKEGVKWPDKYINSDTGRVYEPHHQDEADFVFQDTPRYVLVRGGEGSGKGLPLDTVIPTPDGYTTMGELQPGDVVLDEQGDSCTVLDISPVHHKSCYKITFDTQEELVSDEDHLWEVEDYAYRKALGGGTNMENSTQIIQVLNTREIYETQNNGYHNRANYSIPLAKPPQFPERNLSIDPYVLGSWLGDGTSRNSQLTVGQEDRDEVSRIYEKLGYTLKDLKTVNMFSIYLDGDTIVSDLKALDLLQNKHIPVEYLRASYDQRLSLLQGLMDTDGYISKKGNCEFCSVDETLATQVQALCFSLGIKTNVKKGYVKYNGENRVRYRLHFNPNIPVFRLQRKLNRINKAETQQNRKQRRFIVKVEPVESVPTKCITVDSPNSLYLATPNLIPTHNTVSGVIKDLERLRRGMSGIAVSPNLPHFKRSLWPEMRRWIPWECVIPQHRRMQNKYWEPHTGFQIVFKNELGGLSVLMLTGADNPLHLEGPNISFAHIDEGRGIDNDEILKVLAGRVRILGPKQEPPQLYITTTPRMHWLYDAFGPPKPENEPDEYRDTGFKEMTKNVVLLTKDNVGRGNVDSNYVEARGATLNEAQKRVRLLGEWEDEFDDAHFLEDITMWDALNEILPPLKKKRESGHNWSDVMVLAVDASVSRDTFAIIGVTRHPENREHVAVRLIKYWEPLDGKIDFEGTDANPGPEKWIRQICKEYTVVAMVYDVYQLHQMATRLSKDGVVWAREFSQHAPRVKADQDLYDSIITGRIAHSGHPKLREHIKNANAKFDSELHKRRLVKRLDRLKIDLAVALSMASFEVMRLNI